MRSSRGEADTVPEGASAYTVTRTLDLWRLVRMVCGVQGLYYLIAGLWLLVDRFYRNLPGPLSVTQLTGRAFGTEIVVGLSALIGLILLISAARTRPDGLFTGLGMGSALTFLSVEWRYRGNFSGWIYLELFVELAFVLLLFGSFWAAVIVDRRRR